MTDQAIDINGLTISKKDIVQKAYGIDMAGYLVQEVRLVEDDWLVRMRVKHRAFDKGEWHQAHDLMRVYRTMKKPMKKKIKTKGAPS